MIIYKQIKYYTGIGSRSIPESSQLLITEISNRLDALGYTLRSGGAVGSDNAFSRGTDRKLIYLPWDGMNGLYRSDKHIVLDDVDPVHAIEAGLAIEKVHKGWYRLEQGARKLHTRNYFQVMGHRHTSLASEFVVYWAPVGKDGPIGGTATAVKIARQNKIPTYNLHDFLEKIEFMDFLNELENKKA